ncbi:membrane protein DedA with SNARE-associated domain [Pullulanibacillus pueri]|uniref:Alkaline phosphatase n=1 Tax=Pullulanibacillus pueri TaxID=1437324 RepID=A0A8J2ZW24_9BACL|nr:DedA family protein [Pullulanibacillus pueri]MBM7682301.1 membrane protein DedA with SNARE-associated domain [Pullulanibacillus pueri]GGH80882.1 alkaline phosphatase [Pullulanibacillus pueri]
MKEIIMHVLETIISMGYFGVALALMIEIIPSEIVLAYGGFMVSTGDLNFAWTVVAGTIGATIAQVFLYWIGYYGGRPFLQKYGKYLLIHSKHLDLSERWFKKYGGGVVFFARFVPVVRQAISIPAGIAKMPLGRFIFYTILATIPWSILFIYLGESLGQNWDQIKEVTAPYIDTVALVIVAIFVLYFVYKFIKSRRKFKP